MNTLKEKCEKLSTSIANSGKSAVELFSKFTPDYLMNAEHWWEALAVCEYALDSNADKKLTADFFGLIFSSFDSNAEFGLNDTDYEFWWDKIMQVCDRVAEFDGVGWAEKAAHYSVARYGKRDESFMFPYYEKGAAMGHPISEATLAFWLYLGIYCEQNKEEAERRFAALSTPEAILWGKLNRAYIKNYEGDEEGALALCKELLNEVLDDEWELKNIRAYTYATMGDIMDKKDDCVVEEAEYYQKSLELKPDLHTLKNLGTLYFRFPELGKPKEVAFEYWEKAFRFGEWSAANFLGYNYQEEQWLDMPKAIEWLERGMLYCESYSAYELALIYLYNDEYQNVERGMMCLDRCIEDDYVEAILALANIYFNGELVAEDMQKTFQLLTKAIELGSGEAASRLGWMYENSNLTDKPDYKKALEYYEKSASLNYKDGYARAALFLANGYAGIKDAEKSRNYYIKGVELGSTFSMIELGFLYEKGNGVEQSREKAFELFKQAAEDDNAYGMYLVGIYYEKGVLGKAELEEAVKWYIKGAEAGDNDAMFALGRCYKHSIGTDENPDKALEWFHKGAEQNDVRCITELGLAYETGFGVEENPQKAIEYMTQAANLNYGYAQFKLGDYFLFGFGPCKEDNKKAVEWYEKAIENNVALALLRMGDYYLYDYDRINEAEKAFEYYKKATEYEFYSEGIGICYELGIGVEDNESEAFKYYTLAANEGNVTSMYRLGMCYYKGIGVKENYSEAYRWFTDAANNENVGAAYYLGKMLMAGEGCSHDIETGLRWLMNAAEKEYDKAQFELGNAYLMGNGVEENEDTAMEWFEKAADNGNEDALKITGRRKK